MTFDRLEKDLEVFGMLPFNRLTLSDILSQVFIVLQRTFGGSGLIHHVYYRDLKQNNYKWKLPRATALCIYRYWPMPQASKDSV